MKEHAAAPVTAPTIMYTAVSLEEPGHSLVNVGMVVVAGELMKYHFAAVELKCTRIYPIEKILVNSGCY